MGHYTDEQIMKIMYSIIKNQKEVRRSEIRSIAKLSINQYNRVKSHFEEKHSGEVEYEKSTRTWKWTGN